MLVTPLVTDCSPQVDVVKSAQRIGVPAALCVASWDHLTTKGLIRVEPDLIAIWNEEQRAEAIEYHGASAERLLVTGAQPFDKWFERRPTSREEFWRRLDCVPTGRLSCGSDPRYRFPLRQWNCRSCAAGLRRSGAKRS